ncbi:Putative oxidoreductase/Short-chain dehydrogenase [Minicystis rosea]|nr:Putative oxidoreductase/Short-chain dehydrogenase [Minicystis rosea]
MDRDRAYHRAPMATQDRDLTGKVFLVTGANTGIGRVTAETLARRGGKVFLACRSEEKTRPVLEGIRAAGGTAEFLALDLGSLASVRAAAKTFLDRGEPLHVLINNAGLAGPRGLTQDGFELTFGTNHLGPFLFTSLLLPRLRESAPARIVNVASKAHYDAKGIDWDALKKPTRTITTMHEYQISKLCNVLFTKELARGKAGEGVKSYSLHPGVVASDIWRKIPWPIRPLILKGMITVEEGAQTSLYCATSPEVEGQDGLYYDKSREKKPNRLADDVGLAKELWAKSEAWVG